MRFHWAKTFAIIILSQANGRGRECTPGGNQRESANH